MKGKILNSIFTWFFLFAIGVCRAQGFKEVAKTSGISTFCYDERMMGGGVAFIDFNNDNYQDIFIIGGQRKNALYQNNWDGTFTDVTQQAGILAANQVSMGVAVGDIDNDGYDDIFITTNEETPNLLYRNNGDGTFTNISSQAGITHTAWSMSASFGDFNMDGLLDIYVVNYADFTNPPFDMSIERGQKNFLYQNLGNNKFIEVAGLFGVADSGCGLATAFTDCDGDGDPDIMVANDFGYKFLPNELFINQYPLTNFQKIAEQAKVDARINAMGVAIGDFDKDLDMDYYITNISDNPFYENMGNGLVFQDISVAKNLICKEGTSWGTVFFDYDNDTNLDLFVANGEIVKLTTQNQENKLYRNLGNTNFEDVSELMNVNDPANCRGLASADIDNDGDLDILLGLVTNNEQSENHALLYENNLKFNNNWLKVKLEGSSENVNRNGYASRISVFTGNEQLIKEVDGGSSYLSSHSNTVHFGLGNNNMVSKLVVDWTDGTKDTFADVPANGSIKLIQGQNNWISLRNELINLQKGDSIEINRQFRKENGIFKTVVYNKQEKDSIHYFTKLVVKENIGGEQNPHSLNSEPQVYPNPVTPQSIIKFSLESQTEVKIIISDILGRRKLMFHDTMDQGDHIMNINEIQSLKWNTGLYFLTFHIGQKTYSKKVVWR